MTQKFLLRLKFLAVLSACCGPEIAQSQVMEITSTGAIVHERPEITDINGTTPIEVQSPSRANMRRAARAVRPANTRTLAEAAAAAAAAAELSPDLIEAVAWRESRQQPRVVSSKGAIGEMQLMPDTARSLGINPFDSIQNYRGGAAYLKGLLHRYNGDLVRALAAYNAGPHAVDRYNGVPPFKETRAYVTDILNHMSERVAATQFTAKR